MNDYTCRHCGDEFSEEMLIEFREFKEAFYCDPFKNAIICPDCYDTLRRKDLEEQTDILLNDLI